LVNGREGTSILPIRADAQAALIRAHPREGEVHLIYVVK
jgi:hypothetical protein